MISTRSESFETNDTFDENEKRFDNEMSDASHFQQSRFGKQSEKASTANTGKPPSRI